MSAIKNYDLKGLESLAKELALEAGELSLEKWHQPLNVREKGFRDVVTDADYTVQALITSRIKKQFPDHGFLTEEEDSSLQKEGSIIWVIDPIDGTTNYSRHIPTYCVSIAAVKLNIAGNHNPNASNPSEPDHTVLAGAIYDPFRKELFYGARGHGCYINDKPLSTSYVASLDTAVVGLDWSRDSRRRSQMLEAVSRLLNQVQTVRAVGSAALALAWIAAGRLDAYCNLALSAWDVVAAELFIHEAGGKLTDISGGLWRLHDHGCLATNSHLMQQFVEITRFNNP
jgi:myo-inositol-1(or 4)-monophosphatase